jgi:hypothetical protein
MIEVLPRQAGIGSYPQQLDRTIVGRPSTSTLKMMKARADSAPSLAFGYLGIRACAMA